MFSTLNTHWIFVKNGLTAPPRREEGDGYHPKPMHGGARRRISWQRSTAWRHLPAVLVATGFVAPLIALVGGSLRPAGQPPPVALELWPASPTLANYHAAFETVDLARQIVNSIIVVALAVPLTVLTASWAGFALTRLSSRVVVLAIGASLAALMVPTTALLVGKFAIFSTLGLTDTLIPLIAPSLIGTSPLYVLLYFWSFRRIPSDVIDAARLEGLGLLGIWWRVALPLVRSVTIAVAVLTFVVTWSNFLDPLVYLHDPDLFTVPLGLRQLAQLDRTNYPVLLAASVIATLPVIGAFLYVQRYFLADQWTTSEPGR